VVENFGNNFSTSYAKLEIKSSPNIRLFKMNLKMQPEDVAESVLLSAQGTEFGEFNLIFITISFS